MTKGHLTIENGDEPFEMDIDVTEDDKPITIVITADSVQIHTQDEPKVTTEGFVTEFKTCEGCGAPVLVMLGADPPKSCADHN